MATFTNFTEDLLKKWADAYSLFRAAFDTPIARRKLDSPTAEIARTAFREFDEKLKCLVPKDLSSHQEGSKLWLLIEEYAADGLSPEQKRTARQNVIDALGITVNTNLSRDERGHVLHGCEMCDGEDECTCPKFVSLGEHNGGAYDTRNR